MARVQRVIFPGEPVTYTIVGADHLPVPPAAEYLRFLRESGASPHTVRGYAAGLARWFTMLEHTGHPWDDFPTNLFGQYLQYLRSGDLPGTPRIGAPETKMMTSSLQPRAAAVLSMYRYHADTGATEVPYRRLFTQRGSWRRQTRYVGFLDGVGPHRDTDHPIYPLRQPGRSTTPVLSPSQVATILDGCSVQDDGNWTGGPAAVRNRLFFAVLAETGMRLGEALSLRHNDFHIGAGGTPWIDIIERQDHPHGARVKTGPRRIYVGDDLEALYSEYVWQLVAMNADQVVADLSNHFVFVNLQRGPRFSPMRQENVYEKVRGLRKAHPSLPPDWSPHWLRHTHATALLLAGVPEHVVMRRLGHADVQTTLSTYGWVTQDAAMRSLAEWKNFVAGWKGLHDGQS
ncbi:tyrosine-type recombinase/integrase [Mycolicibacterium conceptionense]|uniref:tyrosine-type recombinase/integrase n=1 Tax=Mycolicibacterium conceptionense TaxID=451644 RepID=UPI000B0EB119|nr:tyrosine-type recombinase/integrase [Mycolicibacterium conceptionense]